MKYIARMWKLYLAANIRDKYLWVVNRQIAILEIFYPGCSLSYFEVLRWRTLWVNLVLRYWDSGTCRMKACYPKNDPANMIQFHLNCLMINLLQRWCQRSSLVPGMALDYKRPLRDLDSIDLPWVTFVPVLQRQFSSQNQWRARTLGS